MPLLDTYSQGTVTLYANSTLVVGVGTEWRDALDIVRNINAGDQFVYGSFVGLIKSVDSPTQLTLVQPYPGATASGQPYDVFRYRPVDSLRAIEFMQRERARGGPTSPFIRTDIDTGNVRISLRDSGDGKAAIYSGAPGSADGAQVKAIGFDAAGNVDLGGAGGLILPAGTTAQRIATEGRTRRNTTTGRLESYVGGAWRTLAYANGDAIASDIAAPATVTAPAITAASSVTSGGASVGRARLIPGTSANPGYVEFMSADGTRRAYMGWKDSGGNNIVIQPENGWGLKINGPVTFENRATFGGTAIWDAGTLGFSTPEEFNSAAGTGGDDTAAIQSAINTGRHVILNPVKDYKTSASLNVISKVGQHIIGGNLKPMGNFNAIVYQGAFSCELDIAMKCAGMTGGYAVSMLANTERCTIRKLHILDSGFNVLQVQQCNAITVDYLYAINLRGTRGIRWYGTGALRSDILNFTKFCAIAAVSGNTSLVGIDWDGNCNSLFMNNVHIVNCLFSMLVQNTSGGPPPMIGRINAFGSDFSYDHGINIVAGDDIDFNQPYINGAGFGQATVSHHGMLVSGPSVAGTVRVLGGKSIGNRGHGFASVPANTLFVHGAKVAANLAANGLNLHPSSVLLT